MNVLCVCGDVGGSLTLSKRFTGSYMLSCDTEDQGVIDVLFEGSKSDCFDYLLTRIKKFHDRQYPH